MSALEALDRYIKHHEVTLQSISKQKLTRTPIAHNEPVSHNTTNISQLDVSMGYNCRPSIATELQNLIMRLKHVQQSRLSQLQQANALFLHEMNIEDQFNMDVKTEQECNNELAEDEFEAFLLGATNHDSEDVVVTEALEEAKLSHPTLFTRTNLSQASNSKHTGSLDKDGVDKQKPTEETKLDTEDFLSMSFTDDVLMQLQRSRQERTQRLRSIATSIQCTSAQSTPYPISTFKTDVLNLSTLPPASMLSSQSRINHSEPIPAPPAPPISEVNHNATGTKPEPSITLQSILDDEQFSVTPVEEKQVTITALHAPDVYQSHIHSDKPPPPFESTMSNNTSAYLVNNRSRKAIEEQLVQRTRQHLNLGTTTQTRKGNHSEPPIPPLSPRSAVVNKPNIPLDQNNVHGIGYGHRYEHTIHGNNEVERWEESSVGSADDSVRSLDQHFIATNTQYNHNTSNSHAHNNSIFDYADALESPQRKPLDSRTTNRTHNRDIRTSSTHAATVDRNNQPINTKHVAFVGPSDVPVIQRAVEVECRVSRYYQQRMYRLEYGTDMMEEENIVSNANNRNTYPSAKNSERVYSNVHSPERKSSLDHNFDSPLPKTPTFPPIFS